MDSGGKMENTLTLNHDYAIAGWAALLVWWGIVVLIDPLTIGMGAIGTGLVLFGINIARSLRSVPYHNSNYAWGAVAVAWGSLDTVFNLSFEASFAVWIILIGLVMFGSLLFHRRTV
jgi:hypothetical protein